MSNLGSDSDVDAMPCDPDLLVELGRVTWAAARLHAGVRDAINHHHGVPSDEPFDATLGGAVHDLAELAKAAGRTDQTTWVADVGRPAVRSRNRVVHAVTYTADDGRQAIRTSDYSDPGRFLTAELRQVTLQLIEASRALRL